MTTKPERERDAKDNGLHKLNVVFYVSVALAAIVVFYAYTVEAGWIQDNVIYNDIVARINELIGWIANNFRWGS